MFPPVTGPLEIRKIWAS